MVGDVLLRKANQTYVANNVNIGFRGVERQQLGSFPHASCGGINPCGLPPNVMNRSKSIEKSLSDYDRGLAPISPRTSTYRRHQYATYDTCALVEFFRARTGLNTHLA